MPKVPDYVSSQQVPGSAPFEQASGEALSVTERTIAAGFKNIEQTGMLAQRHIQYIEAEKERQRQANIVVTKSNEATEWFGNTEKQLQHGYKDENGQQVPPVGSQDYISTLQSKWKDYQATLLESVGDNSGVRNALDIGLKHMYNARLIQAQHFSNILHVQEQESEDKQNAVTSAKLAVEAPTPEARNLVIQTFNAGLDVKYGNGRPKYVETLKESFANHVQTNYMEKLLHDDPIQFQIQRDAGAFKDVPVHQQVEILDRYNTRMRQQKAAEKEIADTNRYFGREGVFANANTGKLSEAVLDQIKDGSHPYIDAHEYARIKHLNDNPPNGEGTQQVRALRNEYLDNRSYMSKDDIAKYSEAATQMGLRLGVQHPELTKFKEELKTDWRSITNMDSAQMQRNLKRFEDNADQDVKISPFGGTMTNIQKQKEHRLRATQRDFIRDGKDPDKAAEDLRKARSDRKKGFEGTTQGTIDSIQVK